MPANRSTLLGCASLVLFAVAACSPAAEPPADTDLTVTLPQDGGKSEMAEIKRLNDQRRENFLSACAKGDLPPQDGVAASPADCASSLGRAEKSAEAARILHAVYAPNGAASATSLEDIRARLPQVNWTEEQTGGSTVASGKLGDFDVAVTLRNRRHYLSFNWNGPAGVMPVDIAYALALSGTQLTLIACKSGDTDETGRVWRAGTPNSEAFDLTTYSRVGPSGTALSYYSASVPLDRNLATLETLRAEDSDWNVCG